MEERKVDLFLCNPCVDTLIKASPKTIRDLGFSETCDTQFNEEKRMEIKRLIKNKEVEKTGIEPAGSSRNTAVTWKMLDKEANIEILAPYKLDTRDKKQGLLYDNLTENKIEFRYLQEETPEGTLPILKIYSIVSTDQKDTRRYMISNAIQFPKLTEEEIEGKLEGAKTLTVEGYVYLANQEIVDQIIDIAVKMEIEVNFSISTKFLLENKAARKGLINNLVNGKIRNLYGNDDEIGALAKVFNSDVLEEETLVEISDGYGVTILETLGAEGARIITDDKIIKVDAAKIEGDKFKNTLGAGDAFLGGYLAGKNIIEFKEEALEMGAAIAKEVISIEGPCIRKEQAELVLKETLEKNLVAKEHLSIRLDKAIKKFKLDRIISLE